MDVYKRKDRRFPREFKRVVKYIKDEKNIEVVLGEETDYVGPFDRRIIIHHNYDLRNHGLYILLFACGMAYQNPIGVRGNLSIQEWNQRLYWREHRAWEKGLKIANTLDINMNHFDFCEYRNQKLAKFFSKSLVD